MFYNNRIYKETKSLTFSTISSNNNNADAPTFYINPPINKIDSFHISNFSGVNVTYVAF